MPMKPAICSYVYLSVLGLIRFIRPTDVKRRATRRLSVTKQQAPTEVNIHILGRKIRSHGCGLSNCLGGSAVGHGTGQRERRNRDNSRGNYTPGHPVSSLWSKGWVV